MCTYWSHHVASPSPLANTTLALLCPFSAVMKPKWEISCCRLLRPIQNTDPVPPSFSRSFTRGNTKSNQNLKGQYSGQNSPVSQHAPPLPSLTNSPSMSSSFGQESGFYNEHEPKRFLNEKYAKCSVKGNFLTLAAQPKNVELGEWLAHQCMFWTPTPTIYSLARCSDT